MSVNPHYRHYENLTAQDLITLLAHKLVKHDKMLAVVGVEKIGENYLIKSGVNNPLIVYPSNLE